MLAWVIVYLVKTGAIGPEHVLVLLIAMGCDVGIVYYIASAVAGKPL